MTDLTHQQWLEQSAAEFSQSSDSASLDARVLLSHSLEKPLSYLLAWPDRVIGSEILDKLNLLKQRRLAGEPIAYITGHREFWSMDFKVSKDVLIPRPETELLVDWALQKLSLLSLPVKVLELGTGSGAIAVALASELPEIDIIATDISENALVIARQNAINNAVNRECQIKWLQGSWFACLGKEQESSFELIVSNPPYVAPGDPHLKQGDLPYEPITALVASENGLSDIENIIVNAKRYLKDEAWIGLEHGYNQADEIRTIMLDNGYQQVRTIKDLADIDRVTIGQWNVTDEF